MWPAVAICVILGLAALFYIGYRRSKAAQQVKDEKIEALEEAAAAKREEEKAKDEAEAKAVVTSGDALDFLRNSFSRH